MIDLFGVSLSSTVLFVLAGILIGHLLWYRDNSAEAEKVTGLENRYFKARGSVRKRKRELTKLQRDSKLQQTDLEQTRHQQGALLKQNSDIEQEHRDALAKAERLTCEKQELDTLFKAEQARSETVVAQLQEVLQARSSSENAASDQLAHATTRIQDLESQLQHDRAQRCDDLVSVQQRLGDATGQAQEYKESLDQHVSKHQAVLDELERTRAQIEQDQTELSGLRATGQQMVETIAQQKAELIRLQSEVGELESVREQTEEISKEFVTVSNQRDDLEKSRSEIEQRVNELQSQLLARSAKANEVTELLSAKTQEYSQSKSSLEQQIETHAAERQQLRLQLAAVTQQHGQQVTTVQSLTAKLSESENVQMVNQDLQGQIADLMEHLKRVRAELEDSLDANEKTQDRVRELEEQVHEQTAKFRRLRSERGSIIGIAPKPVGDRKVA